MGVKTVIHEHGIEILTATAQNDLAKLKVIFDKRLKSDSRKIREVCESEIYHKPTKTFACPLMLAVRLRDATILRYMLEHGVNPNFMYSRATTGSARAEVVTPLHVAVDLGNFDIVDALLAVNADCNVRDHNADCPLHVSVLKSDVAMTRTLLARGADMNATDRVGNTSTHVAARFGHYQLVATLVAAGADINRRSNKDGALPIQVAAREGHWHCVKLFQTPDGAPVDSAFRCFDENREVNALHLAASGGHHETIQVLLDIGANVNFADSHGNTALHCLVLKPYRERRMRDRDSFRLTAKILIDRKVKVNARNGFGDTALHLAAMNNYLKVVELLLECGALIDIENKEHLKPIDIIPKSDHVTRQLLKSHASKKQQQIQQSSVSVPTSPPSNMTSSLGAPLNHQSPIPMTSAVPTVAHVPSVVQFSNTPPTMSLSPSADRQLIVGERRQPDGTTSSAFTKIVSGSAEGVTAMASHIGASTNDASQITVYTSGEYNQSSRNGNGSDAVVTQSSSSLASTRLTHPHRLHVLRGANEIVHGNQCCHRPAASIHDDRCFHRHDNDFREQTRQWASVDSLDSELQSSYVSSDRYHPRQRSALIHESRMYANSDGDRGRQRSTGRGNFYDDPYRLTKDNPTAVARRERDVVAVAAASRRREDFRKQRSNSVSASETSRRKKHRNAQLRTSGRQESYDDITLITPLSSAVPNEVGFYGSAVPGQWPFYRISGNYYDDAADLVERSDYGDDSDYTDDVTTVASADSPRTKKKTRTRDKSARDVRMYSTRSTGVGQGQQAVTEDQLPVKLPKKSMSKSGPAAPNATSSPASSRAQMSLNGQYAPSVVTDNDEAWSVLPSTEVPNTIGIHCGSHNITISVDKTASSTGYGKPQKQKGTASTARDQAVVDQPDGETSSDVTTTKQESLKTRRKARRNMNAEYEENGEPTYEEIDADQSATMSHGTIDEPEIDEGPRSDKKAIKSENKLVKYHRRSVVEKQLDKYNYRPNNFERTLPSSLGYHNSVEV